MLPLHHSLRDGDRAIRTLARDKPPTCFQDKSLKPLESDEPPVLIGGFLMHQMVHNLPTYS